MEEKTSAGGMGSSRRTRSTVDYNSSASISVLPAPTPTGRGAGREEFGAKGVEPG